MAMEQRKKRILIVEDERDIAEILKYNVERSMILSGTFIHVKNTLEKIMPTKNINTPKISDIAIEVWTAFDISLVSFAPIHLAIKIPDEDVRPIKKKTSNDHKGPFELTAAKASLLIKRPATKESAAPYVVCNSEFNIRGMAKMNIFFKNGPSVILRSFVLTIHISSRLTIKLLIFVYHNTEYVKSPLK